MSFYKDWENVKKGWDDFSFYDESKSKLLGTDEVQKQDNNIKKAEYIKNNVTAKAPTARIVKDNKNMYIIGGAVIVGLLLLKGL